MRTVYKTKTDSETWRTSLWLPGGRLGEGIIRKFGMDIYTLLYLKWITNKDLLYSTWNLLNVMWQSGWEGSLEHNGYMYMHG